MKGHYHFIGIGGIGMGALAALLMEKGYKVTGSDIKENSLVLSLREKGADIAIGHAAENIKGADRVIFSSAINRVSNPELLEAKKQGIRILQRAQLLAELMKGHIGITIAGAHGKTTTTSMIANLLTTAGFHPTTAVGGIVNGTSSNARLGAGEYFVAEVDESDGSFLNFFPKYSVITNIDFEHMDYFRDWDHILSAYRQFIQHTDPRGMAVVCGDDPHLPDLVQACHIPFQKYGLSAGNDIRAENIRFDHARGVFDCVVQGRKLGEVVLNICGRHNVVNALACAAVGLKLSIDFDVICRSLKEFQGVERRFQTKGKVDDIWVMDDYAHHPTEIRATLEAARLLPRNRVVAVFQPHRYSRVQHLLQEMAGSLTNADYLVVTDIYAASEQPIEGVTATRLVEEIRKLTSHPVVYLKKGDIISRLLDFIKPGDVVMILGAGDITHLSDDIVRVLQESRQKLEA